MSLSNLTLRFCKDASSTVLLHGNAAHIQQLGRVDAVQQPDLRRVMHSIAKSLFIRVDCPMSGSHDYAVMRLNLAWPGLGIDEVIDQIDGFGQASRGETGLPDMHTMPAAQNAKCSSNSYS